MNLVKSTLWPYALLSILLVLCMPILFPVMRIAYLVPLLVILFYQRPLPFVLWCSLACGLFLDLIGSTPWLGLNTCSYCLAAAAIYPLKRHFFADNLSTLPILTFFLSALIAILQAVFIYVFEEPLILGLNWIVTDVMIMPAFDAIYAFGIYLLPLLVFGRRRRRGRDFFLHS